MGFGAPGIDDYYRQRLLPQLRSEILRESDAQIIGTDTDELKNYYFQKYAWSEIEEDVDIGASYDVQDYLKTIYAHERERGYGMEGDLPDIQCQRVVVEVPILPNEHIAEISQYEGSTHSLSYSGSDFQWSATKISQTLETKGYGFSYDPSKIATAVEASLGRIRETIRWRNDAIKKGNAELLHTAFQTISARKQKIEENKTQIAALTTTISIPIKKKVAADAVPVRLVHKPLVLRVKPTPKLPEEYVVSEERVNDVITLLDQQAQTYERAPDAVKKLGEEHLRDLLLANLNSVFDGAATGETFSKRGKTDIYLQFGGGKHGDILICECKIWGGQKLYAETIDQLRGYLTWRQNYGIMITYVKNKDFTKVLLESEKAIHAHESFKGGFKKVSETHYFSSHFVDDADKEVKLHHLFYHLA